MQVSVSHLMCRRPCNSPCCSASSTASGKAMPPAPLAVPLPAPRSCSRRGQRGRSPRWGYRPNFARSPRVPVLALVRGRPAMARWAPSAPAGSAAVLIHCSVGGCLGWRLVTCSPRRSWASQVRELAAALVHAGQAEGQRDRYAELGRGTGHPCRVAVGCRAGPPRAATSLSRPYARHSPPAVTSSGRSSVSSRSRRARGIRG